MTRDKVNKARLLRLTADKREIEDPPKLPLATSFIRKTLSEKLISVEVRDIIKLIKYPVAIS